MSKAKQITEERKWRFETFLTILSFVVSLIALIFTLWYNLAPGRVQPFKPSGYAIIRGTQDFPSDHLVIPLEWLNNGGRTVLIRHLALMFREQDIDGKPTGNELTFYLAGEYPNISEKTFETDYSEIRSFPLEPHSITVRVLVFHINKWWDENGNTFNFRFPADNTYKVSISYAKNLDPVQEFYLFDLMTYNGANTMDFDRSKEYWWDFWNIEYMLSR